MIKYTKNNITFYFKDFRIINNKLKFKWQVEEGINIKNGKNKYSIDGFYNSGCWKKTEKIVNMNNHIYGFRYMNTNIKGFFADDNIVNTFNYIFNILS